MIKKYNEVEFGVGAKMTFVGNSEAGEGNLEILKEETNSFVEIQLEMIKPFDAKNLVEYKLTPEDDATRFTWIMSGSANFVSKLISVFMDCEKMVGDKFEDGIARLKSIVESKS